jgi:hypothetical protein
MPYICSCSLLISRSCFSRSTTYHLPGNRVTRAPQVVLTSAMPELNNAKNSARARSSCAIMETRYSLASCGIPVQAHCRIRSLLWSKASGKGPASRYVEPQPLDSFSSLLRFKNSPDPVLPRPRQHPTTPQLARQNPNKPRSPALHEWRAGPGGKVCGHPQHHPKTARFPLCPSRLCGEKYPITTRPFAPSPTNFHPKKSKNFLKSVSEHRPLCVKNTPMWTGKEARRA